MSSTVHSSVEGDSSCVVLSAAVVARPKSLHFWRESGMFSCALTSAFEKNWSENVAVGRNGVVDSVLVNG